MEIFGGIFIGAMLFAAFDIGIKFVWDSMFHKIYSERNDYYEGSVRR